eukprot:TRINITY_DN88750_c0_g1_i1.p1 TRINITY_DN88750_c0_g1~~TRINITY_DN88750_c0_g1_i1.p1  ORF type:complete len:348 (-),score=51.34 TRINITY_DN88750_c0_g1_i1:281-1324(-)
MELGQWLLHRGKEHAEKEEDQSQSQSADIGKRGEVVSASGSQVFGVDLLRQASRSISQSPSTEASLGDEATSVASIGEWSRENSGSKDGLDDFIAPVFIVKNTFIDEVMPPVFSSRVRSSSAPPSPSHRAETVECVLEMTSVIPTGIVCADKTEDVVSPCQCTRTQAEKSIVGTAFFPLPRTAAPTAEPARLPLISVGVEVEIESPSRAPELNGLAGVVQGWEAETGTYHVMLRGSTRDRKSRLVKVKPENIRCSDPPPPNFDASSDASLQTPGPPQWGVGDNLRRGEFFNSFDTWPLLGDTHFQHHPYCSDTFSSGAVLAPMPMPFNASNHSQYNTSVFPWLPEAR